MRCVFLPRGSSKEKGGLVPALRDRFYFATGMVNSAPLAMLSGQRCITLL
ncbi:Uncharacterised protein [Bordetella hinzii]|nr:Uncharacterised protein [Bordetella hinzii]